MIRKNYLLFFALVVIGIVLVFASSCKKDDKEDETNNPTSTNSFTATIGGSSFVGANILRQAAGGAVTIMGKSGTQTLGIIIQDTVKVGTYPLLNDYIHCRVQYNPTDTEYYMSTSGSVIFTEFSKTGKIKGTFSCEVTKVANKGANISITNGVIDVSY